MNPKSKSLKKVDAPSPAPAGEVAATMERISALLNDPLAPATAVFRVKEEMSLEMERMIAKLDTWQPGVICKLYPVLVELSALYPVT